jgi:hypothetical protein
MLTDNEREFWRGFLAAEPGFASDGIGSAVDGPNPPDVLCATLSASKITALVLGWFENSVVRSDSRGFGVAGSFLPCAFVSIVW